MLESPKGPPLNLFEFLTHEAIQLPVVRTDDDFLGFVDSRLYAYSQLVDEVDEPSDVKSNVSFMRQQSNLCGSLRAALEQAFLGRPACAYEIVAEACENLSPTFRDRTRKDLDRKQLRLLYRVRPHNGRPLPNDGIFHIPFELRHLVDSKRFSVPGLPCLYLAGSLYTCWAEMGMPSFPELAAAAFWLNDGVTVSVLDLSHRGNALVRNVDRDTGVIEGNADYQRALDFMALWPLLFLCSIIVKDPRSPFKPEYVIPQLVLQWIADDGKVDGVCYASTHIREPAPPESAFVYCNYVFPAETIEEKGHCTKLRNLFSNTDPHNWQLLMASANHHYVYDGVPGNSNFACSILNGISEQYQTTDFGQAELRLQRLAQKVLNPTRQRPPECD